MSSEINENRQRHAAASNGEPDQLISVISDVERQLSLLRTLKEEREASRQRIVQAEAAMKEHAAELSRREQSLEASQRSIEERRRELEQRGADLAERQRSFERASQQLQSELDARHSTLESRAAELANLSEQTRARAEALDRQASALAADRQALDQAEAELARRERVMAEARAEFDRLRQRVEELEQELTRASELAEQRAAELSRRTTMAQALAQQVDELRSALEVKGVELAAHMQTETALRGELGAMRDQLAAQGQAGARLEHELRALQAALDQSEARGRELLAELSRQQSAAESLGRARDQLRAELDQQVRRMEEEQATLHQSKAEAQHLAAAVKTADGAVLELRRQVVERDAKIQFLSQRITTIMAERDQQLAELRQSLTGRLDTDDAAAREIADRDRRLTELQLALSARDRRIEELAQAAQDAASLRRQAQEARTHAEELRAQLQKMPASNPADDEQAARLHALASEVARLREAIGERDAAIELLRSGAAMPASAADDAEALEQLQADTDALRAELEEARGRLAEATQENRRLRSIAASAGEQAELPAHVGEAIANRRRRLSRVRSALRQQHEKLTRASDALRQRYEQCEQILAQRDQLAAARQAMVETQRRLDRQVARAAKVKAAAGAFYVVATLVGLAGLSWAASAPLSTQVYAASASIGVKDDGRYQNPEALQHWQTYVEGLRSDPLFRSGLSESLLRAGFASRSTAGEVASLLENELRITSPTAGQIDFAIQGEGAARTQRLLETVTTAYLSEARATKDRRVDQLDTDLRQAPAADPTPIHDDRPMIAGGIFLPLAGVTFIIGGLAWRRLAASKAKFEAQSLADSALDPALWRGAQAAIASTESIR